MFRKHSNCSNSAVKNYKKLFQWKARRKNQESTGRNERVRLKTQRGCAAHRVRRRVTVSLLGEREEMERKSGARCVPAGRGLRSGTRRLVAARRNFTTLGGKVTQSLSAPPVTSARTSAPPFTRQAHERLAAFCGRVCHSAGRQAPGLI